MAAVYGVTAWLAAQALGLAADAYEAPGWVMPLAITVLLVGFPVAIVLAWALEVTPEGVVRTENASPSGASRSSSAALFYVFLIGTLGIAAWLWLPSTDDGGEAATVTPDVLPEVDVSQPVSGFGGRGAVAVLPFTNMSDDASQEYFADGITEDIITSLQAWGVFPVISRNSTFVYKGGPVDVRAVGEELGVRYVLEGSVRTAGERIRITAQLIDAQSDTHLWADNYDRDLTDIFALQDEITEQIVTAIAPEITRGELRRASTLGTTDLEAYDLVLRAQWLMLDGDNPDAFREATSLLNRTLEIDPDYALAWARLAEIDHNVASGLWREMGFSGPLALLDSGLAYARRAVQLDPNLVDARIWFGHILLHKGRIEEGLRELAAAVELNPSHGQAHAELGQGYALSLRLDDALRELAIASRLSPNDPRNDRILIFTAIAHHGSGQYEEAALFARRLIDGWYGIENNTVWGYVLEISSLVRLGRAEEARASADDYRSLFGEPDWETLTIATWVPDQYEAVREDLRTVGFVD